MAIKKNPKDADAYINLANILKAEKGKEEEALKYY
jgi:tetratricopeptide (TPR) repeat protein